MMSELRNKMRLDLELKGYSPETVEKYLYHVSTFAKYFNKSPELLGEDDIRQYLHYCSTEKHLSEIYVNTIYASLKFIYTKTLDREWDTNKLPRMKICKKLPDILSQSEVSQIFA